MYLSGVPRIPRVRPQLLNDILGKDPPATAGSDCNVKVTQAMIEFATRGATYPSTTQVRNAMGVVSGGTGSDHAIKACAAFGVTAKRLSNFDALEAAWTAKNAFVSVGISYRWVNDNHPEISGDLGFDGNHRIGTWGAEQIKLNGVYFTAWDDSTHDWRQRTIDGKKHRYPKSVLWVPSSWIEDAMVAMGSFSAIYVTR
jgi:hypothetical protein